jgi:hypothetical protein
MDIYNALKKVSTSEGWSATKELKVVCEYIESLRKLPPKSRAGWEGYLLSFSEFLESKCLSEKDYK